MYGLRGREGKEGVDKGDQEAQIGRRKTAHGHHPQGRRLSLRHPAEKSLCANVRSQGVELRAQALESMGYNAQCDRGYKRKAWTF